MGFAFDAKTDELRERLSAFMDEAQRQLTS